MTTNLREIFWGATAKCSWAYIYSYRVEILVYSDWVSSVPPAERSAAEVSYSNYRTSLLDFHGETARTPVSAAAFWQKDEAMKPLLYNNTYIAQDEYLELDRVSGIAATLQEQGVDGDDAVRVASSGSYKTVAELEAAIAPYRLPETIKEHEDNMKAQLRDWALSIGLRVTNDAMRASDAQYEWADPQVRTEEGARVLAASTPTAGTASQTPPTQADEFFTKMTQGASRKELERIIAEKLPGHDFSEIKTLAVLRMAVALALTVELRQNGHV